MIFYQNSIHSTIVVESRSNLQIIEPIPDLYIYFSAAFRADYLSGTQLGRFLIVRNQRQYAITRICEL